VPWCLHCDRYLTPPTVRADGTCPNCGQPVDAGRARAPRRRVLTRRWAKPDPGPGTEEEDEAPPVPWHLKLLLVALAIYLTYRLFQGVAWVVAHV